MRRLTLPEHQARSFDPIPRPVAEALSATGAVKASADLGGRTVLQASSHVGVLRAGDIELRITPKIGIRRLLWLIGHAQNPKGWRDDDIVELATTDDIVSALAVSFRVAAQRATIHGLLKGYKTVDESLPGLRGRLREADQLRYRHGLGMPLEVRYDDYTTDIPENQILLAATHRLLRIPDLPPATLTGLRRLQLNLSDVTPLGAALPVPETASIRLTRHYQSALRLARLVLTERSLDQPPGDTTASGFVFDLNRIFERWLTVTLRRALEHHDGELHSQYRSHLDTNKQIPIQPDLVWVPRDRPATVVDAKYKGLENGKQYEADLYQMVAYCTALGAYEGHLIYASGDHIGTHTVRQSGIRIHICALDLDQPPENIWRQVAGIATTVAGRPS
ncbi:McrC family protein [Nocardia sputi]|uniref:McrC family protein n=1 Tax=Nocardia sputi TaxID=2943705 RepID=UPI0020C09630|nr:McrC family protein [Nocardia sputi]